MLPLGLFARMGKFGYNLFSYFYKGAKVDASLNFSTSSQRPRGMSDKNPSGKDIYIEDAIRVFDFQSNYTLTLINASSHNAYNVRLINADEIFSGYDRLIKNLILQAGASISINCWFTTNNVHIKGNETNNYHGIPTDKKNKMLLIAYENEARITFYTRFKIDDRNVLNEYSLKMPNKQ